MEGRAITTVVPSTTAGRAHLDHDRTRSRPPRHHGLPDAPRRHRPQHDPVAARQRRRGPDPAGVQRHEVFGGRPVPVVTKSEFRTSGFTGAHLRDGVFHGWQTTAVLVEHVRALVARRRAPRVRLLPGHRRGRPRVRARRRPGSPPSSRPPTGWWARCSTRSRPTCAVLVTADHGQVAGGARRLDRPRAASTVSSTSTRATAASVTSTRARARATTCTPPPRSCSAPMRGSSRATSCSTRAGSGPTPRPRPAARRRRRARSPRRRRVRRPDLPPGGPPDVGARVADARGDARPDGRGTGSSAVRRRAVRSNHSRVILHSLVHRHVE